MTTADARIRRFSTVTFLAGSAVAVVLAFIVVPFVGINPATGDLLLRDPNAYESRPWNDPAAREVRLDGETLTSDGSSGFLDLPAGDDVWVIGPIAQGERSVSVFQQVDASVDVTDARPEYIGLVTGGRRVTVVSGDAGGRLWFGPQLTRWQGQVTRETATPVTGSTVSGDGSALLVYTGDALSGRFVYEGDGYFGVEAIYPGVATDLVSGFDGVDVRASWPPGDRVVFRIDTDEGSGKWTIRLDEPASDSP